MKTLKFYQVEKFVTLDTLTSLHIAMRNLPEKLVQRYATMEDLTPAQKFYKDKTIFITGGSGFMGKVLLEKLLYSCTDLKEIILIMRPKKGKSPENRLEDMWKIPMFQRLRDEKPHVFKKVKCFNGDVCCDNLGLDAAALQYIKNNTEIVFHLAATLKLEGNLKDAIEMNTTGTKRTLDIAREMKKLVSFVHLSTAFCNCDEDVMYEKIYEYPHKPEDLIKLVQWMDIETLDKITPNLIKPHPNTYTYSKRLAEILVRDAYPDLPVTIARPSIVLPAVAEPLPGWVDNLNGPTGVMIGAGKGVIRTMMCDGNNPSEIIPVDYAINGILLLAHDAYSAKVKSPTIPVYTLTAPESKKVPWKFVLDLGKKLYEQYPCTAGLWYPGGGITTNKWVHKTNQILFMLLPAYFIDFLLLCFGQKRFMIFVQNRISIGLEVLQFFTMRKWEFHSDNYYSLWNKATDKEKKVFGMDFESVDVVDYMTTCVLGGRQYVLKEPLSNLDRARTQMRIQYFVDRFCKILIVGLALYWVLNKIGLFGVFSS